MKKFLSLILIYLFIPQISLGLTLDDLNTVKDPAYRVGTTNEIENKIDVDTKVQKAKIRIVESQNVENLTYADLSIKKISAEISQALEIDYDVMLADLSILWQGAAVKSETIKYAL